METDAIIGGAAIEKAQAAILLIHGRGASAEGMMGLFAELDASAYAAIAPRAPGGTWYPYSFMAAIESNQPHLDNSLAQIRSLVDDLTLHGIPAERIALLGFSQGACLALEFVVRNARRYGGIMGLSGGLIGPPGNEWDYSGSLARTPVFLGGSDPDAHVPFARVQESRDVLTALGAKVEIRRYPGMEHTINNDELDACRQMLQRLMSA